MELIVDSHPHAVEFPNLLKAFDNTFGYESQIKKLRNTISKINESGRIILKIKSDLLIQQKNASDKRVKEIRINQQIDPD